MDVIKLKTFADDKVNIAKMTFPFFERVENTVDYQHFLLFPQYFPQPSSLGSFKSWYCVVKS